MNEFEKIFNEMNLSTSFFVRTGRQSAIVRAAMSLV